MYKTFHCNPTVLFEFNCCSKILVDQKMGPAVLARHNITHRPRFSDLPPSLILVRGALGGKTGKTGSLPGFCKIECGGGAPKCFRGLIWLGGACHAGCAPACAVHSFSMCQVVTVISLYKFAVCVVLFLRGGSSSFCFFYIFLLS